MGSPDQPLRDLERGHLGEDSEHKEEGALESWSYSKGYGRGLPASSAPTWTVRPYIHWGYRDIMPMKQCLFSLFSVHNETGNIFTHLLGLLLFFGIFIKDATAYDLDVHHRAVATFYNIATQFCMGSSAFFHLVQPHSKETYDRALKCDMTGIAMQIISSYIVGIHYGYWCHPVVGRFYQVVVGILSFLALIWPHVPFLFQNFYSSVVFFASFVAFAFVPMFHWVSLVGGFSAEQVHLFFWSLLSGVLMYCFGFVFYIGKFPEKKWPGRFDLWLHSHQLWHLCVLAGAIQIYLTMISYSRYRMKYQCEAAVSGPS